MAGVLYRKTSARGRMRKFYVIACHGKILIFDNAARNMTGVEVAHIIHEKKQEIPLDEAYVYSGIVTESDMQSKNQTFDSNNPGRHALPRVYDDGWMSSDEDAMTSFVLWHGSKRSFVRPTSNDGKSFGNLRRVTALGQSGRAVVFKARSRQERDIWVMAIGMEIERLHTVDEIRVKAA